MDIDIETDKKSDSTRKFLFEEYSLLVEIKSKKIIIIKIF